MKQARKLLVLLALVLALTTILPTALAYFTTNASAAGSVAVALGSDPSIKEDVDETHGKTVTITNGANSAQPVFVRMRAFASSDMSLNYSENDTSIWEKKDDGWYYLRQPLAPGDKQTFYVNFNNPQPGTIDDFDITVVYETTPVVYDKDGNAQANWDLKLDTDKPEQGQS